MKVIRAKDKEELLEEIEMLEKNHDELYISLRPTQEIVERIVEQTEALDKLKCPKSLYYQVGKKVNEKLQKHEINLEPGEYTPGRPRKYTEEEITKMIELREKGKSVQDISDHMDVPIRTIYYYLNKGLND